jgi:hypothetical protein
LVTPLSAADAAGIHNFYSSMLPSPLVPPFSGGTTQTSSASKTAQVQESMDLETPGMVAAKQDPLTDVSTPDLTLDILPGESIEEARAHQENNSKLELPLPMTAERLQKEQAAALSVPSVAKAAATTTPAAASVNATPVEDPDAPMPVSQAPVINPVRAPIANPYDILNR